MVPTSALAAGWKNQHTVYPGSQWVQSYWNSHEAHHRDVIIQALERVGEFTSVLELGCNSGPNLRRIHQRWPQVDLTGSDVNEEAILYGLGEAASEGWFWSGWVQGLKEWTEEETTYDMGINDVILSCYTLCYVDPTLIDLVLQRALACATRALVIAEPMSSEEVYLLQQPGVIPEYHYDYQSRLAGLYGLQDRSEVIPVSPPEQRLNSVLIFRK